MDTPAVHPAPTSALFYLYRRRWINRVVSQLRLLKRPRYLLGFLLFVGYMVFIGWGSGATRSARPPLADITPLVTLMLTVLAAVQWFSAPSDTALAYSPADVQFLFPAPVSRRTLLHARLIASQAVLLMSVLLWVLILRQSASPLPGVLRALALWVFFTTLTLHRLGVTLSRVQPPDATPRRPVAPRLATLWLAAVAATLAHALPTAMRTWQAATLPTDPGLRVGAMVTAVQQLAADPWVHALLTPVRWIVAPTLATTAHAWLVAMPAALLMGALMYVWVIRDPAPFEELALTASVVRQQRTAAMRQGGRLRLPVARGIGWTLGTTGAPAVALAWKNVAAFIRTQRPERTLIWFALVAVGCWAMLTFSRNPDTARDLLLPAVTGAVVASLLSLPSWFRLDLRHDVQHLAYLKTAPLAGHTIVRTELITGALLASGWVGVGAAIPCWLLLRSIGGPASGLALAGVVLVGIVGYALVALLLLTLHNAIALWFPAAVTPTAGAPNAGGFAMVGQVYLGLVAVTVALAILLAPPTLVGIGAGWLVRQAGGAGGWSVAAGLVVGIPLAVAEWLGLIRLLGRALERLEPADVPAAHG